MRGPGSKDSSPRPNARRFSAFSLSFETSAGFSREVATAPLNFSAAAVLVVVIQFALSQSTISPLTIWPASAQLVYR
jgi:hypothetical protein